MSLDPLTSCFQNVLILQKIIDAAGRDPTETLELRLVNKHFNKEYLHWIRRTHRNISVHCFLQDFVEINDHEHNVETIRRYFEFLVQVAGVQVSSFSMEYARIREKSKEEFHNEVMNVLLKDQKVKTLVGLVDGCREGCEECKRHVLNCDVYGPVQFDVLKSLWEDRKQHFKKLIVDEFLLHRIATHCSELSMTQEECLDVLKTLITPNISCDNLQLVLCDDLSDTEIDRHGHETLPLPREVIEEICRKWKVKSVTLQLTRYLRRPETTDWTEKETFFTKFRFDYPYQSTRVLTEISLEQVEIDLEMSDFGCSAVFVVDCYDSDTTCENLIANVGQIFPTKKMHVKNYRYTGEENYRFCRNTGVINKKNFEKIIKAFFLNHLQRDMEYTHDFQHRIITDPEFLCELRRGRRGDREHFEFPKRYMFHHQVVDCSISGPFKEIYKDMAGIVENIGMTFRFRNTVTNCVLNLNVYVEKEKLKKLVEKETIEDDEFLKYYKPLL